MRAMFDPYRRLWLYYPSNPKEKTMPEDRDDLEPIRMQITTTNALFLEVERTLAITETHTIIPNRTWSRLALAIADLMNCARRTL